MHCERGPIVREANGGFDKWAREKRHLRHYIAFIALTL